MNKGQVKDLPQTVSMNQSTTEVLYRKVKSNERADGDASFSRRELYLCEADQVGLDLVQVGTEHSTEPSEGGDHLHMGSKQISRRSSAGLNLR